ncbi:L-lactate dehydrogenase A-like 6A isoform X2 [Athalia rosae]|uniref:L-lactate dehydrogenase A-like 6A isoform X2 n=1 Tax=Athalia rosae TaxID=37344 RepID=UPI002033DB6A|nr:L-lactate dehydrogenase A-like 6A isoform X2 [Athalia rosae]
MKMTDSKKKPGESRANTATFLLTRQTEYPVDGHRVKIVVVGSGQTGVAIAVAILFKRLASELVLIDSNEDLAKAQAEDLSHAAAFLGNPKIVGTKGDELLASSNTIEFPYPKLRFFFFFADFGSARDAAVCVFTAGRKAEKGQDPKELLEPNLEIYKSAVTNVCKYAPNSVLVIVTSPVDIMSYAAMKMSGFPPNRVIGLGTFLDTSRFQYFIAQKLGISASSVQALVIGENGASSVPVWSAVAVMGMKLKDINKEIGQKNDPEGWNEVHEKVVNSTDDMIEKKGCCNWGAGICAGEIVDAIVRNTCVCLTVSTYVKVRIRPVKTDDETGKKGARSKKCVFQGCRHGLEKDVFMSLPCVIGRNGVQSYVRHSYTAEEQELTAISCRAIYETQRPYLDRFE